MIREAFRMAVREIRRNLVRSFLTVLGILIGVAAVIVLVGLGRGATLAIEQDLQDFGVNLILVFPGTGGGPRRVPAPDFTLRDVEAIDTQIPWAARVVPVASAPVTATWRGSSVDTTVTGSTDEWVDVFNWTVAEGRRLSEGEVRSGAPVCVVGADIREELVGSGPIVGERIRLDALSCTVVGVFEPKGANTFGMPQDDFIFAPLPAVQRRLLGTTDVQQIAVSVDDPADLERALEAVEELMMRRRNIAEGAQPDFEASSTEQIVQTIGNITGILTTFLAAVASLSLLVGGIGIMNIMLVSVTERTREIGVRMAVGALQQDVLVQFLVEAGLLAALGGFIGVILGLTGTWLGAWALGVPFVADPLIIVLALGLSALIGVVFGWFPARRAARLEPIDALRHT